MIKRNCGKKLSRFKKVNIFLLCGAFAIMVISLFASESIRAQIGDIYDQKNDEIAGITALMSAVTSNDITGVKFFSKAGKALINQKNIGGATSLHIACREKNLEIVKVLVENGADVNVVDNEGWTPLMRASLSGEKDIVDLLLLKGAQAGEVNSVGESVITHAALSDCTDCLDLMFKKFNFIKSMNNTTLQNQLTEAFIVAKNHDNKPMQVVIEAYLDRVVKMAPLVENVQRGAGGFVLNSSGEKTRSVPMLAKQNPATSAVVTRFRLVSGSGVATSNTESKVVAKLLIKNDGEVTAIPATAQKDSAQKGYKFLGKVSNSVPSSVTSTPSPAVSTPDAAKDKMVIYYMIKK